MAVCVIGGGLAGCEAAWQIAQRGVRVDLYEMKPTGYSPAHHSNDLAEMVCSNSLKAKTLDNASGLLKEEMRRMNSIILKCADDNSVPAGGALAVDREKFSQSVTFAICNHSLIKVIREEVESIDEKIMSYDAVIIATGPLTSDALASKLQEKGLALLNFFDAAAPIIMEDSIDHSKVFKAARYGKGSDDYINCPMNKEQYLAFYNALISAKRADVHDFDNSCVYEGCMPVEVMAERGVDTLRFGPLKPVGLNNPDTGEEYYAVCQLRQDNSEGTMFNMVGFQTRLTFGEQKRVFGLIPGLENAEFARYGVMHRNTYINSPGNLDETYLVKKSADGVPLFFAGQITGVEGYIESASSGLVAGINAARIVKKEPKLIFPSSTMIGALANYAANYQGSDFQPMGANFGIVKHNVGSTVYIDGKKKKIGKSEKKQLISESALNILSTIN
ncbi:MAG: methylenetetrahydrofolate--tRNA-(uracil(54)-C(5))-methyltransferase (FADH(2)-oxidizing) TrmFO [Clostridia bacterium]|nr:methylenetetrahydrofolate--tRNA-(uracil(54)-C(5))-methyltransferase (FADH(2)-oxidizing) TrmFO [Clostridia bacterium]